MTQEKPWATIDFKGGSKIEITGFSTYRLFGRNGDLVEDLIESHYASTLGSYLPFRVRMFANHLVEFYAEPGEKPEIWVDPRFEQPPDPNLVY